MLGAKGAEYGFRYIDMTDDEMMKADFTRAFYGVPEHRIGDFNAFLAAVAGVAGMFEPQEIDLKEFCS